MVLLLRTFISFERKKSSGTKFAVRLPLSPPELINYQGLTNKVPGNFLFIVLTVAGTYGFSAESKRL